MQDNLVGYLVGALDEDETAQLEARLQSDPALQARLQLAAQSLRPLMEDVDEIEPPSDLVAKTCCFVSESGAVPVAAARRMAGTYTDRFNAHGAWRLVDVVVAASVLLGACLMCFPAINNARYHAQMAGCQNNLRQIGQALIHYSHLGQGYFPVVPSKGNFAVAGMYAPTLIDHGLVVDDYLFLCPATPNEEIGSVFRIPSLNEIQRARGQTLAVMQRVMGGQFGYTLGYRDAANKLRGIANRGRDHFPLMSDAPGDWATSCSLPRRKRHRHVLFESGRVCRLPIQSVCWQGDDLFVNDRGEVSAGMHAGDAVIGSSATTPLPQTTFVSYH
jgi:hypothetical protein